MVVMHTFCAMMSNLFCTQKSWALRSAWTSTSVHTRIRSFSRLIRICSAGIWYCLPKVLRKRAAMSFHGMCSSSLSWSSRRSSSLSSNCVDICESDRFLRLGSSWSSSSLSRLIPCERGVSWGRGAIGVYMRRGCGEGMWLDDSSSVDGSLNRGL